MSRISAFLILGFVLFHPTFAVSDQVDDLLADIRSLKNEALGSAQARQAWDRLVKQGPVVLPRILAAMDTPDPAVCNWLRLAFEDIVERNRKMIDVDALVSFAKDSKHFGRPRRLALELAEELRPGLRKQFLVRRLDDPEFRYDAIEGLLERLQQDKSSSKEQRIAELRRAFASSRDLAQARLIASRLKENNVSVSVASHLGFLSEWQVIGPFDGFDQKGFQKSYPPEQKIELTASYKGKDGKELRWKVVQIPESPSGKVPTLIDLRKPLGSADDAVAYAFTQIDVASDQTVEFRGAADDNFTVWVNEKKVFAFEEYQNGVRLDRHRFKVTLKKGVNSILVKICQGSGVTNPPPNWEFLLRITNLDGQGLTFPSALKGK